MALQGLTHAAVHLVVPPSSLFAFPPPLEPPALPPQQTEFSLERPFNINPDTFRDLLSVHYPLTIAAIYATTVSFLNRRNARRKNKPWRISKTRPFYWFVIAHNIFLAVYSAWTCWGMFLGLKRTIPINEGFVGVVDSLCKMQGPRGLSSAVTYNPVSHSWGVTNQAVKLFGSTPDPTDVGRLWNEGLAFYGWLFYLSKFYEVLDTLIILAKGKKSSLLQTYHHAGAMLCMWAGIRFMSPPIWMFVLVNSGIHALMYSYYTLSALGVRVPNSFKRSLTSLQILQFVVGAAFAIIHLFVAYELPVQKPYLFINNMSTALPTMTQSIVERATAGAGSWLKKLALRAAGEEGAAEKVLNEHGHVFGSDAVKAFDMEKSREEIRYQWETAATHCVDTPGQAFAIYLNVMYLAPLTYLFAVFFVRSYLKKASKRRPSFQDLQDNVRTSSFAAARDVNRAVVKAMSAQQGSHSDFEFAVGGDDIDIKSISNDGRDAVNKAAKEASEEAQWLSNKAKSAASGFMTKSQTLTKNIAEATQEAVSSTTEKAKKKKNKKNGNKENDKSQGEEKASESYADAAKKSSEKEEKDEKPVKEEDNEESKAKALVERAYAAAKSAAMEGEGDANETISLEDRDESAYEANIDEAKTEEEKEEEDKMQAPTSKSGLFN